MATITIFSPGSGQTCLFNQPQPPLCAWTCDHPSTGTNDGQPIANNTRGRVDSAGEHDLTVTAQDGTTKRVTYQVLYLTPALHDPSTGYTGTAPLATKLADMSGQVNDSSPTTPLTPTKLTSGKNNGTTHPLPAGTTWVYSDTGQPHYDCALSLAGLNRGSYRLHFTVGAQAAEYSVPFSVG